MAAQLEVWESNISGRVAMEVAGARPGTTRRLTTMGKGQRLRITVEDRELVEEGIRNIQNNPFANGKLTQIGGKTRVAPEGTEVLGTQQFSDDDLAMFFAMTPEDFRAALGELSEANVRRLRDLFRDKGGTVAQQEVINDYIEEKWPVSSGDTPSYREMRSEPAR